jgi:hypothetical protein
MRGNGMAGFACDVSGAKCSGGDGQTDIGWQFGQQDFLKPLCGQAIGIGVDQQVIHGSWILHLLHFLGQMHLAIAFLVRSILNMVHQEIETPCLDAYQV